MRPARSRSVTSATSAARRGLRLNSGPEDFAPRASNNHGRSVSTPTRSNATTGVPSRANLPPSTPRMVSCPELARETNTASSITMRWGTRAMKRSNQRPAVRQSVASRESSSRWEMASVPRRNISFASSETSGSWASAVRATATVSAPESHSGRLCSTTPAASPRTASPLSSTRAAHSAVADVRAVPSSCVRRSPSSRNPSASAELTRSPSNGTYRPSRSRISHCMRESRASKERTVSRAAPTVRSVATTAAITRSPCPRIRR